MPSHPIRQSLVLATGPRVTRTGIASCGTALSACGNLTSAFVMKKLCLILFIFIGLLPNVAAAKKLGVFVSILPQKYFVEQVGTNNVSVQVMVGPGQNPATYEPTPGQMAALAKADIYFSIGVPFESAWLDKIKNNNTGLVLVDCREMISGLIKQEHRHRHGAFHDPHVWTSPKNVIQITKLIEKVLIKYDTKNSGSYKNAAHAFIERLINLDNTIRDKTSGLKQRAFIVSHPSWAYFANEYGFRQISIERAGKEIQANAMARLIKNAKAKNIKAVFVQPQFNRKPAEIIAGEIDAEILELDPLAVNYLENMRMVTDRIVQGLEHE